MKLCVEEKNVAFKDVDVAEIFYSDTHYFMKIYKVNKDDSVEYLAVALENGRLIEMPDCKVVCPCHEAYVTIKR
jgi:hypothetical protein